MEKYKLIKDSFAACSLVFIIVFAFIISQQTVAYASSAHSDVPGHSERFKVKEPFEIRNGRLIFIEHCAPCHGDTGQGNGRYYSSDLGPKPRDFTDHVFMNQTKDEYLIEVIRKGTAAFGKSAYCPPWGTTLKEDEKIENVVDFLRTLTK